MYINIGDCSSDDSSKLGFWEAWLNQQLSSQGADIEVSKIKIQETVASKFVPFAVLVSPDWLNRC